MKIIVNPSKCPQNHTCPSMKVCPKKAITQLDDRALPRVDEVLCIMCGKCMKACPKGAFEKVD